MKCNAADGLFTKSSSLAWVKFIPHLFIQGKFT
jgi:hypothetical protein